MNSSMENMNYPSINEVESAGRVQLATWYRFLQSPGMSAVGKPNFDAVLREEKAVMDRICARFKKAGGFNPKISKGVGWDPAAPHLGRNLDIII